MRLSTCIKVKAEPTIQQQTSATGNVIGRATDDESSEDAD